MQSLATIGYEMKKALADRICDNNNNNNNNKNNVGGHWGPVSQVQKPKVGILAVKVRHV